MVAEPLCFRLDGCTVRRYLKSTCPLRGPREEVQYDQGAIIDRPGS